MPSSDIYEMYVCVSECATPSKFLLVCILLYMQEWRIKALYLYLYLYLYYGKLKE